MDVAQARLELLKPTHMVDYAMDIYREVHGENAQIPQEMEDQKAGVFKKLEELKDGQSAFEELCRNEEARVSNYCSTFMLFDHSSYYSLSPNSYPHTQHVAFISNYVNRQTSSVTTNGTYNRSHPIQATASQLRPLTIITNLPSSTLTAVTTNKDVI